MRGPLHSQIHFPKKICFGVLWGNISVQFFREEINLKAPRMGEGVSFVSASAHLQSRGLSVTNNTNPGVIFVEKFIFTVFN